MKNRIQEMETTHPLVAFRKGMVQRRRRPLHQDPYGFPEQRNHTVGKRKVRNELPFYQTLTQWGAKYQANSGNRKGRHT